MTSTLVNGLGPENIGANGTVRNTLKQPYLEIVEQPASKALRFRYECEGRSAGSIPGVHNTPEHKTFPTVRIVGFKGRAVIIVSCITKDEPYRAHPHNLVGKENCRDGICTMEINNDSMTATFSNLGIQCVKKKDIEDALRAREEKRVDPFRQGFAHSANASTIDLNAVRLCFQAFLSGSEPKKFHVLTPVVSDVIYDKKAMSDLVITKLSHASAPALSRQEMILLCEKVAKEDIQVRFFEEINNEVVWEGIADFTPPQVHKQVGIWFKTPQYTRITELEGSVNAFIQLRRPSDNAVSEALPFKFRPEDPGKHAFWLLRTLKPDFDILAKILVDLDHPLTKEILALRRSSSPVTSVNIDEMMKTGRPSKHFCRSEVISDDESEDDDEEEDEDEEEERVSSESTDKDEKDANDGGSGAVGETVLRPTTSTTNEKSLQDAIDDLSTVTPDKLSELGLVFTDTEEVGCEPHVAENSFVKTPPFVEQEQVAAVAEEAAVLKNEASRLHSSVHMAMKNTIRISERITFASKSNKAQLQHYEPMAPPPRPPAASKPNFEKAVGPSNVENEPLPPLPPKRVKRSSFLNPSLPALPHRESKLAFLEKLWPSKRKKKKSSQAISSNENDDVSRQSCRSLADDPSPNDVDDDFITEAENYALYTSVAPRATDSEFDETSCYYSPVEAGPVNNKRKRFLENPYKIGSHSPIQQQQQQPGMKNTMMGAGATYMSPPQHFTIKDEPRSSPDCPRYADLPQYTPQVPSPLSNYPTYSPSLPSYYELRNPDSEQPNPPAGYPGMLQELVSLQPVQPVFPGDVQVTTVSSSEFPPTRTVNLSSLERLDSTDFVHVEDMMLSESMNQSLNIAQNDESNMNDSLTNFANTTFDRDYKQL